MFRITSVNHVNGHDNKAADGLSRFTESIVVTTHQDPLLPPVMMALFNEETEVNIEEILKEITVLQQVISELQVMIAAANRRLRHIEGVVHLANRDDRPRIYVPTSLRRKIIEFYHLQYGHVGMTKTAMIIHREFDWPGLQPDVVGYINSYVRCRVSKHRSSRSYGPMKNIARAK